MRSLDDRVISLLARMPFLDRLEATIVSGWSRGAVYGEVRTLEDAGLVGSIPHATELISLTRRFHLTAAGLRRFAELEGTDVENLLRVHPISARWRRILLDRLDPLAVIYRLASAVANVAHPVDFRWYRGMPMDAAITLSDRRTLGILRQGITSDRSGFSKRLWRLTQVPQPGVVLLLLPDEMRLRYARRRLARTRVAAVLALEREAAAGNTEDQIWRLPNVSGYLTLREVVDRLPPDGALPMERPLARISLPKDLGEYGPGQVIPDQMLPALLRPAEKQAMDLIASWPWLEPKDLAGLMGVSRPRVSQIAACLEDFGLVTHTSGQPRRLVLSDMGIAMLARRDRTAVGVARRRWSVNAVDVSQSLEWSNIAGRRSRQLLRHAGHTSAVHGFVAAVAAQVREVGWETIQLDPPIRASRYFRFHGGMRSIHPDAFGLLRSDGLELPFFLEWERRAVRPSAMRDRLAPYLRYYSTRRPVDDHGSPPLILVVFTQEAASTGFLRVAVTEMARTGISLPLMVSHEGLVQREGPLGRAWFVPGVWEPRSLLPTTSGTHKS